MLITQFIQDEISLNIDCSYPPYTVCTYMKYLKNKTMSLDVAYTKLRHFKKVVYIFFFQNSIYKKNILTH